MSPSPGLAVFSLCRNQRPKPCSATRELVQLAHARALHGQAARNRDGDDAPRCCEAVRRRRRPGALVVMRHTIDGCALSGIVRCELHGKAARHGALQLRGCALPPRTVRIVASHGYCTLPEPPSVVEVPSGLLLPSRPAGVQPTGAARIVRTWRSYEAALFAVDLYGPLQTLRDGIFEGVEVSGKLAEFTEIRKRKLNGWSLTEDQEDYWRA
ncbi:hypothetical protein B0H11DRAFT_1918413 [Mycena galericulata]|nr:hypothetical protein B0H11DRAFT_1918413 [Mycena galericulata]